MHAKWPFTSSGLPSEASGLPSEASGLPSEASGASDASEPLHFHVRLKSPRKPNDICHDMLFWAQPLPKHTRACSSWTALNAKRLVTFGGSLMPGGGTLRSFGGGGVGGVRFQLGGGCSGGLGPRGRDPSSAFGLGRAFFLGCSLARSFCKNQLC